ncbi:hypothetical protein HKCCE4037_11255 [Rhodobacterales bacterium HKCCE4037]|nr:hypothetical protein [Rhodobacterales bacterium HKCCE4037]
MDISSIPARVELSVPHAPIESRMKVAANTGRPETANPVTAVDAPEAPAPAKRQELKPLDVFQVGDNDDVPVPPEPPRRSLALVAVEVPEATPEESPQVQAEAEGDTPAPTESPPEETMTNRPAPEPYGESPSERASRTLDIRR